VAVAVWAQKSPPRRADSLADYSEAGQCKQGMEEACSRDPSESHSGSDLIQSKQLDWIIQLEMLDIRVYRSISDACSAQWFFFNIDPRMRCNVHGNLMYACYSARNIR
jgi:hypothetical protein